MSSSEELQIQLRKEGIEVPLRDLPRLVSIVFRWAEPALIRTLEPARSSNSEIPTVRTPPRSSDRPSSGRVSSPPRLPRHSESIGSLNSSSARIGFLPGLPGFTSTVMPGVGSRIAPASIAPEPVSISPAPAPVQPIRTTFVVPPPFVPPSGSTVSGASAQSTAGRSRFSIAPNLKPPTPSNASASGSSVRSFVDTSLFGSLLPPPAASASSSSSLAWPVNGGTSRSYRMGEDVIYRDETGQLHEAETALVGFEINSKNAAQGQIAIVLQSDKSRRTVPFSSISTYGRA